MVRCVHLERRSHRAQSEHAALAQELYLIDHGASLYFHHDWPGHMAKSESPFVSIKHHALLPLAESIRAADAIFAPLITQAALETILALVPDAWLTAEPTAEATRSAYVEHLFRRVSGARAFVEEAERVRVV